MGRSPQVISCICRRSCDFVRELCDRVGEPFMFLPLLAYKYVNTEHRHPNDKAETHPYQCWQQPRLYVGLKVERRFAFVETLQYLLFSNDKPFREMLMKELCPFVFGSCVPKTVAHQRHQDL